MKGNPLRCTDYFESRFAIWIARSLSQPRIKDKLGRERLTKLVAVRLTISTRGYVPASQNPTRTRASQFRMLLLSVLMRREWITRYKGWFRFLFRFSSFCKGKHFILPFQVLFFAGENWEKVSNYERNVIETFILGNIYIGAQKYLHILFILYFDFDLSRDKYSLTIGLIFSSILVRKYFLFSDDQFYVSSIRCAKEKHACKILARVLIAIKRTWERDWCLLRDEIIYRS